MRNFIDIVTAMEAINNEDLPSVILLLDSNFNPNESISDLQARAGKVEDNFGNNIYKNLFDELIEELSVYRVNYSRLLTNGVLDGVNSSEEKEQAISLVKIIESLLERTKNNDLSWAWEDIKL